MKTKSKKIIIFSISLFILLMLSACNNELEVSIMGEGKVEIVPQKESYTKGSKVKLVAKADDNWKFSSWNGDIKSDSPDITIVMNGNKSVKAVFIEDNIITFKDDVLEANIRHKILNKLTGEIRKSDIEEINTIKLSGDVKSLEGIEHFTNLRKLELDVSVNDIKDISPLSKLNNLEVLNLSGNKIEDITPLSELKNIKKLNLSYNKIKDISSLANLSNLGVLYLCSNKIEDIEPLSGLQKLTKLNLANNKIKKVKPLSTLSELTELALVNNEIKDIEPLSELNLIILEIGFNEINNLQPLSQLDNLVKLGLIDMKVRVNSLAPLLEMDSLQEVNYGYYIDAPDYEEVTTKLQNKGVEASTHGEPF